MVGVAVIIVTFLLCGTPSMLPPLLVENTPILAFDYVQSAGPLPQTCYRKPSATMTSLSQWSVTLMIADRPSGSN